MVKGQWAETGVGAVVIAAAAGFLAYSLTVGGQVRAHGYEVRAAFGQVGSLAPGAVVSVAGVKIGTVTAIRLDPKTYLAKVQLDLDPATPLPADSTAKIVSDGLMGGTHVAIEPGGSSETLKPGGEIENTQGAVDLLTLIGQFLRPQAAGTSSAPRPAPAPAPTTTSPSMPAGD